jgi:hypothetical protein
MKFIGTSSSLPDEPLTHTRRHRRKITWRTFRKHASNAREVIARVHPDIVKFTNRDIEETPFLRFFKSIFDGKVCYYGIWGGCWWVWQ